MFIGVLVVLLMLIALLAIPVTLTFSLTSQPVPKKDIMLHWGFGLVQLRIPPTEVENTNRQAVRYKNASRKSRNGFSAVWHKDFRRRVIRFIGDLWRAVHKQDVRVHVRIGLGDPADTGQLWAILGPISGILANVQGASIRLEPEFVDATLELNSSGTFRVIPLHLIYLTGALLLSPTVWQGIRQMRTAER